MPEECSRAAEQKIHPPPETKESKIETPEKLLKGDLLKTGTVYFDKTLKAQTTKPKDGRTLTLVEDAGEKYCYQFQEANGKDIEEWVKKGNILDLKIVSILDKKKTPQTAHFPIIFAYVAQKEPEHAYQLFKTFYERFMNENKTDMNKWDAKAYEKLLTDVGVSRDVAIKAIKATSSPEWNKIVNKWTEEVVTQAMLKGFAGTPFFMVDNKEVSKDLYYLAPGSVKSYLETGKVAPEFSIDESAKKTQAEIKEKEEQRLKEQTPQP